MRSNHALRAQDRTGGAVWRAVGPPDPDASCVPGGASAAQAAARGAPQSDGCFFTPSLGCEWGEHRLDLSLTTRLRAELWRAQSEHTDTFYAARTRVGLKYSYGNLLSVFGEFQDARLYNLSPKMSGAGALYRAFRRWR